MEAIEEIMEMIEHLPEREFEEFSKRFSELDARVWDREFEEDVRAGRLDELGNQAEKDFLEGKREGVRNQ